MTIAGEVVTIGDRIKIKVPEKKRLRLCVVREIDELFEMVRLGEHLGNKWIKKDEIVALYKSKI